jgi:hypothetical protein
MKRLFLFTSAAIAALLAVAPARADLVAWSYDWQRAPVSIPADMPGTGGISLTNEPKKDAVGSSDVVATNLRVFSSAPSSSPDMLNTSGAYVLTLTLFDKASNTSGVLEWDGKLSGWFSASAANVKNAFVNLGAHPLTQTLTLGGNVYTVTIGPYSPPGPPTASNAGSIAAHVEITSTVPADNSPEPASLVLAGLGVLLGGGVAWRRRRLALRLA